MWCVTLSDIDMEYSVVDGETDGDIDGGGVSARPRRMSELNKGGTKTVPIPQESSFFVFCSTNRYHLEQLVGGLFTVTFVMWPAQRS